MGKKLVKTAKLQFEERLRELNVTNTYELCENEVYYLCEDSKAHVFILRKHDNEYRELAYGMQYEALVFGECFLSMMSERFAELGVYVKPLFDWYASADHDQEPFNLFDIFMCDLEETNTVFEDLYEEVPDVKVITAHEQWEKESANAVLVQGSEHYTYKVERTKEAIVFYTIKDGAYLREVYPPLSELRKDAEFVTNYISFVRNTHDSDMEAALEWLAGREYTMSEVTLLDIYDIAKEKKVMEYEDKEVQPSRLPDTMTTMNMYDPFNWLREEGCGTRQWISEFCNDANEYGRLDALYRIIEGTLDAEDEFCNPPTMEEIEEDYQKSFPLLLAGVFENLAESIRKGELEFAMDYGKK